jgi:hypothetical protein
VRNKLRQARPEIIISRFTVIFDFEEVFFYIHAEACPALYNHQYQKRKEMKKMNSTTNKKMFAPLWENRERRIQREQERNREMVRRRKYDTRYHAAIQAEIARLKPDVNFSWDAEGIARLFYEVYGFYFRFNPNVGGLEYWVGNGEIDIDGDKTYWYTRYDDDEEIDAYERKKHLDWIDDYDDDYDYREENYMTEFWHELREYSKTASFEYNCFIHYRYSIYEDFYLEPMLSVFREEYEDFDKYQRKGGYQQWALEPPTQRDYMRFIKFFGAQNEAWTKFKDNFKESD